MRILKIKLQAFSRFLKRILNYTISITPSRSVNQIRMIRKFLEDEQLNDPHLNGIYRLIHYSPEYMHQWIQLLDKNREFGGWDEKRFMKEMLGNLIPGTEVLLTDQGKLIGSSAAFSIKKYEPYAVLAYPIVLPKYRNRGIGTFLIAKTLMRCQHAGYPGVILYTDDFRTPAIRVYHNLGFVPDTTTSE